MSREQWEAESFPNDTIPGREGWTRYLERLIAQEAAKEEAEMKRLRITDYAELVALLDSFYADELWSSSGEELLRAAVNRGLLVKDQDQ